MMGNGDPRWTAAVAADAAAAAYREAEQEAPRDADNDAANSRIVATGPVTVAAKV